MLIDTSESPADAEAVSPRKSAEAPKTRLLTLNDLDGRTRAAQLVSRTIDEIESDLGGRDVLSTTERMVVRRGAMAGAMAEDLAARWLNGEPVDPASFATLANVERRQFETVGLKRRQRDLTPSIHKYLEQVKAG